MKNKIFEFVKRYWYVFAAVIVLSVILNIYLLFSSGELKEINARVTLKNSELDRGLKESQVKEEAFQSQVKEKEEIIADLDAKLSESLQNYTQLKNEVSTIAEPENPQDFKELKECKGKYALLSKGLKLSLAFGKETERSLTLCQEKSKEQQDIITLTESSYRECQEQGKKKSEKYKNLQAAMADLDRHYKRKRVKGTIVKLVTGAAVGIVAWRLLGGK